MFRLVSKRQSSDTSSSLGLKEKMTYKEYIEKKEVIREETCGGLWGVDENGDAQMNWSRRVGCWKEDP